MSGAYGWVRQRGDHRDLSFNCEEHILAAHKLPKKWDLWEQGLCPSIWDQFRLGSCTAHGSLRAYLIAAKLAGVKVPEMLSRLMQYYDARRLESTTGFDAGAQVRDAIKALAQYGCAPESEWAYDIARFAEEPPASCYSDAHKHMVIKFQAVDPGGPGAPVRTALSSGMGVVFGFSVPQSFEDGSWDPATEVLSLPGPSEGFVGGHCVVLTGYDFTCSDFPEPFFWVDNSWGAVWGAGGRFRMDYRWLTPQLGLAADFWVIQKTTG